MTSSWESLDLLGSISGKRNRMDKTNACRTSDAISATVKLRLAGSTDASPSGQGKD
jgi:hypothetical protein